MTSVNKSTMTEDKFNMEEEIKRMNLLDKLSLSRMGSIVNTADVQTLTTEKTIDRKDSSNTESFERKHTNNNNKKSTKMINSTQHEINSGEVNVGFEGDSSSGDDVSEASRRCSEHVNSNCSGRRRKFEPKYATINV